MLSSRLKALTEQALVVAEPYSERPPRFTYELSESGRELAGALRLLADWGARTAGAEPYRHEACGTGAGGALVVPDLRASSSTTPRTRTSSTCRPARGRACR